MNQDILTAALASSFLSTVCAKLIDCAHEWNKARNDEKKRILQRKEQKEDFYNEEKREVYIEALKKLSIVRAGFDVTNDFPYNNKSVSELIEKANSDVDMLSAKIRLYASDDVYNLYSQLSRWSRFAFTRSSGQWRLMEEGKELFSVYVTLLARLMQEDMGYREYLENPETVMCPNCGVEHDAYKKCRCGFTWQETIEILGTGLRDAWMAEQESSSAEK